MKTSLFRRLVAEALGTAVLVVFGTGAVVAGADVGAGTLDYSAVGVVALSFAFGVALAVYAFGPTSGAHLNPAVSVALACTRRFPWVEVIPYAVAQLVGACAGSFLVWAYAGDGPAKTAQLGLTALGDGVSSARGLLAEAVGTFLLLLVIMSVAVDSRAPAGWAGLLIGLAVAAEIMVIGAFTGGSVNPARTFGPYFALDVLGGDPPWSQLWVYVVGPTVGAAVGALLYEAVARPLREVSPLRTPRQPDPSEIPADSPL